MKICLKIITTEPVILQTWSGAHPLRYPIFWRCNFFSISLGVLLEKKFLDNRDCLTHNSTDSLWCLFSSLDNSLETQLFFQLP